MYLKKSLLVLLLFVIFTSIVYVFTKRAEMFESQPVIKYFYLEGCGWCQKFSPEWDKFAQAVKDEKVNIVVQKLNASENEKEVEKENIQGFPHVHLIKEGKRVDFEMNRTAEDLMEFVKQNL